MRRPLNGLSKRERNRRLTSLGLSRHDDEEIQREALAIVERLRKWTDRCACCVTGWRSGERRGYGDTWYIVGIEWAHVTGSRGSWEGDFGCTVPLFSVLHAALHRDPGFWVTRGLDPALLAKAHAVRFFAEHPDDAEWIAQHAEDFDAVALAQTGLDECSQSVSESSRARPPEPGA